MKKKLFRFHKVLILLGVAYLFFLAGVYFFQEKVIFLPTQEVYLEIDQAKLNAEEFLLKVNAETHIHGYLFTQEEATKTIMFFHGNGGNLTDNFGRVAIAKKMGFNIALFDYRGYGRSTGEINSEEDIYKDSEKVYEYLTEEKKIPRNSMIFWGHSLGSAVAMEMATRQPTDKLVLESSFSSLANVVPTIFRYTVPSFLIKYKFDNLKKITQISAPAMVIHSPDDKMIDYQNGLDLFAKITPPKEPGDEKEKVITENQFLAISGDHFIGFLRSFMQHEKTIKEFLDS